MHDDFVERDRIDREVLARLLRRHPALRSYRRFRDMRLRQLMSRLAERRARAQERRLLQLFDCVLPRSQIEYARYRSLLNGAPPCRLLGWPPSPGVSTDAVACGVAPRFDAGFIAGDYPYNVEAVLDFCSAILPLIRRQHPDFTLLIAGRVAEPLALLHRAWPGVEFAGYLPDPASFYESVRLVVVPLLSGTGISIKTIEALQHGKPVVSTTVGARGVNRNRDDGLLEIADAPEDFAERVSSLLSKHRGSPRPAVPLSRVERDPNDAFAVSFDDLLAEVATAQKSPDRGPTALLAKRAARSGMSEVAPSTKEAR
jgi:glycosyltransferase involved in cell wall biosynthesis